MEWKQTWPTTGVAGTILAAAIPFAFLIAAIGVLIMTIDQHGGPIAMIGGLGGAPGLAGIAATFVFRWGFVGHRLSPGVRALDSGGVVLREMRGLSIALSVGLAGFVVYGFCAWLDWQKSGKDSTLLPASKDSSGGAKVALVFAIVLGVCLTSYLVMSFRAKTTVTLRPAGIEWVAPARADQRPTRIDWDAIDALEPGRIRTARSELDVIYVERRPVDIPDAATRFAIPVHRLACAQNQLLAILEYVRGHPEARDLLARADAPSWFSPPPLRKRIGSATGPPRRSVE
ncbi:hypothetical protein [Nocardia heshunensis]